MVHMFGYAKIPDVLFRIEGSQSHFASILRFLANPSGLHHFDVQTYVQSICHLIYPMIFLKVFLSICPHFDKIASQSVKPLTAQIETCLYCF